MRVYVAILALFACFAIGAPSAEASPSTVESRARSASHDAAPRLLERALSSTDHGVVVAEIALDDADPDDLAALVSLRIDEPRQRVGLVGASSPYSRARARLGDFPGLSRGPPA